MIEMSHEQEIDIERYFKYLNENPRVYIDLDLIKRDINSLQSKIKSRHEQIQDMFYSVLGFIPEELTRYVMLEYLKKNYVPEELYTVKSSSKNKSVRESLGQESLNLMIKKEYCIDFCQMYLDYKSKKYYFSKINILLNNIKNEPLVQGNEGENLVTIPFKINRIRNRRFSTLEQNVIGFYGTLRSSMKAKKGYLLIGGDFPQIDGRGALNLYLKTDIMRKIVNTTEDSYLVFKELVRHTENELNKYLLEKDLSSPYFVDTKNLEKRIKDFDNSVQSFSSVDERNIYKVISLRTVYNSQSSPFKNIDYQIRRLHKVLNFTGRYRMISEVARYFRAIGYPIIARSRWGATEVISETTEFGVLSKLFNTPIQTTSSEIIVFFTLTLLDKFKNLGYTGDDIRVYLNRHDEPIFEVKEELFWKYAQVFKDASYILIHGWKSFKIKWNIGYQYGDNNNKFTQYLDSLKYDETLWKQRTEEHINDDEPLTMDIPEITALTYRFTPDGNILVLLTRPIGCYPMNEYYYSKYRDSRNVEYRLIRGKINEESINEKILLSFVSKLIKDFPKDKTILINLGDNSNSRSYNIGEHSVFLTGYVHKLIELNKIIMGNIIIENYKEIATLEDKKYFEFTKFYEKRLIRRVV